jgi:hypothetical protein
MGGPTPLQRSSTTPLLPYIRTASQCERSTTTILCRLRFIAVPALSTVRLLDNIVKYVVLAIAAARNVRVFAVRLAHVLAHLAIHCALEAWLQPSHECQVRPRRKVGALPQVAPDIS